MPGGKTKTLSLCEKLQLIEEHEQQKRSARQLAVIYGVGKTQVYETLKNKQKIQSELLKGTSGQRKRLAYVSSFEDINNAMWKWFSSRMAQGVSVSGPMIQAEALRVAQTLGKTDFKASNGWLESFRSRHNIVYNQVCVEAKDVIVQLEEDWRRIDIPKISEGYPEEDIFIATETGLCYKMLPKSGGCRDRLGVLLCMNMKGTLLKPLVVGKIARPKAFGNLDAATLPVHWRPSSQACMTNFVLEEWLHCFNELMKVANRKVVLFLDSSCQPLVSLSNVKLVRYPQPLDQGVIFYFKCLYRKSLLQTVLLKLEDSSVGEVSRLINVLDAVNWISRAATNIPSVLVRKCFVKSGFTVVDDFLISNDDAERKICVEISEVCQRINLDPQDVLRFDDVVTDDNAMIVKEEPEDSVEEEVDEKINILSYCDAVKALDDLEKFAAYKDCPHLLNVLQDAKDAIFRRCLGS